MCWRSTTAPSSRRREPCPPQRSWRAHNDGPVPDPPLHPMPFHANFDTPIYDGVRRCTSGPFRPKSVATLADRIRELANERLDELLPRGTFDLTQDYGGIVAASVVCELLGLPVDLAADVLATVNAGSLAQPGSGVEVANARPGYLEYLVPIVQRRRADGRRRRTARSPTTCIDYRLPDGSAFTDIEAATQMLGVFIGGTETVPKIVAHGLWELSRRPDQLAAVRADLDANVPDGARGDDPVLRARAVVRPHRAQAVHHSRHHDRAGTADHHTARVGQPRRARVPRPRRVHLGPAHRAAAGVRPRTALLPRRPPGPAGDRDHGVRVAQAGARLSGSSARRRRGRRRVSSGAGTHVPVEV